MQCTGALGGKVEGVAINSAGGSVHAVKTSGLVFTDGVGGKASVVG